MRTRKTFLAVVVSAAAISLLVGSAFAQTFPTRPVRIAVPFPAGGGTDLLARLLAEELGRKWGQTVYVENLSGAASGSVGASEVARSTPDGHTLMLSPPGPITMNQLLYKSLAYDSIEMGSGFGGRKRPLCAGVAQRLRTSERQGIDRDGKGQSQQDHLCFAGGGHRRALGCQAVRDARGHQVDDRAVSRVGARAERHRWRSCRSDFRYGAATSLPLHQSKQVQIVAVGGLERSRSLPMFRRSPRLGYRDFGR